MRPLIALASLALLTTATTAVAAPRAGRATRQQGQGTVTNATRAKAFAKSKDLPTRELTVTDRGGRVVGVLWRVEASLNPEGEVRSLVRPVTRLKPGLSAREALGGLRSDGGRMGIVERDGRPIGVVSPKDLFEPLMGELQAW